MEIAKMLVLSTSHLTADTCNRYLPDMRSRCYLRGDFGYFLYANDEPHEDDPADLITVLAFAAGAGVEWVLFDRDAPETRGLPVYDWDKADDDGCPAGDAECLGDNGDCHDACEAPALVWPKVGLPIGKRWPLVPLRNQED